MFFKVLAVAVGIAIFLGLYFVPTIVAYRRKHAYRHVIFGVNAFAGFTGIGWLVAVVWAAWPSDKSLIDPLTDNVTGTGYRGAFHSVGAAGPSLREGQEEAEIAYDERRRQRSPDTR